MEERYKTLAAFGVRNIEQYNRNVRAMQDEKKGEPVIDDKGNELKTLPFIVVLIDELADLMMVAGNEVEESIARLAQMARAIGIHLVLATQRPSVDVITGLIKANMPARISFRVTSKIDSRTILDGNGAEQLLGKGDMLYPAAGLVALRPPARALHLGTGERPARELPAQAGQADLRHDRHGGRKGQRAGASGVRQGRAVRRSVAHRGVERPGVDLVPAATAAHRLQPRGAARRHDGDGRARLGRRRRQAARGARQEGILRRSGCTASIGGSYETPNPCGIARGRVRRGRPAAFAQARTPRATCTPAPWRRSARCATRPASRRAAQMRRVVGSYESLVRKHPASGYCDNALWQAANLASLAYERFGDDADRKTAGAPLQRC